MWTEAPTKAYLIGIVYIMCVCVSVRLTSQMSIIKFVFKMSTLHNKNENKSHAVDYVDGNENGTRRKPVHCVTLRSVWTIKHLDVRCHPLKPFIYSHCSLHKSLSDFFYIRHQFAKLNCLQFNCHIKVSTNT